MAAFTAIDDPSAYFKVQLYTGNGSANHAITFNDTDTDMQPDFVWIKNRDATDIPCLFNAVNGATKRLDSTSNAAEVTDTDTLDSFTSDGFQVDADVKVNTNTEKYVAWCWKAGTTSGITTNGSTDTTPSAYTFNQTSGFSCIKYVGNGVDDTQVAHGLGVAPHFILIKNIEVTADWCAYHQKMDATAPGDYYMVPSGTGVRINNSALFSDAATDSVNITYGTDAQVNGTLGHDYIAYCFAPVQGYSKFGSYEGNGNADGPFVYTGFRPAFLLIKNIDQTGTYWIGYDNKRPGYNVDNGFLEMNYAGTEGTTKDIILASNGFKPVLSINDTNQSGKTYIYAAFAEAPFVNSNGVPCNAR